MSLTRILLGGKKERLVWAWVGSLAPLVATFVSVLFQLTVRALRRHDTDFYPNDYMIWPMRIAAAITLAGPLLIVVGSACWLGLLAEESISARTKAVIGSCLALSTGLTILLWSRFLSMGDG
jgi:hypothetical protein